MHWFDRTIETHLDAGGRYQPVQTGKGRIEVVHIGGGGEHQDHINPLLKQMNTGQKLQQVRLDCNGHLQC